jgi:hypothetical protein
VTLPFGKKTQAARKGKGSSHTHLPSHSRPAQAP